MSSQARPAVAWLDVPGATPEQRRSQLIVEMTEYGTKDDLADRQLTRSAIWALLFVFALPRWSPLPSPSS